WKFTTNGGSSSTNCGGSLATAAGSSVASVDLPPKANQAPAPPPSTSTPAMVRIRPLRDFLGVSSLAAASDMDQLALHCSSYCHGGCKACATACQGASTP